MGSGSQFSSAEGAKLCSARTACGSASQYALCSSASGVKITQRSQWNAEVEAWLVVSGSWLERELRTQERAIGTGSGMKTGEA